MVYVCLKFTKASLEGPNSCHKDYTSERKAMTADYLLPHFYHRLASYTYSTLPVTAQWVWETIYFWPHRFTNARKNVCVVWAFYGWPLASGPICALRGQSVPEFSFASA